MSRFVTAKLVKRTTDDGLVEVKDDVPLGREYQVDLDSIEILTLINKLKNKEHTKEVIWADNSRWIPTELLSIPT